MLATTVFVFRTEDPSSSFTEELMKKILPLTVVENDGRFEVRLDGRLIQIRTRSGTLIESVFTTRLAAEGYRAGLLGLGKDPAVQPLNRDLS